MTHHKCFRSISGQNSDSVVPMDVVEELPTQPATRKSEDSSAATPQGVSRSKRTSLQSPLQIYSIFVKLRKVRHCERLYTARRAHESHTDTRTASPIALKFHRHYLQYTMSAGELIQQHAVLDLTYVLCKSPTVHLACGISSLSAVLQMTEVPIYRWCWHCLP